MEMQNANKRRSSDADLMLAVERARRGNRARWERDLWRAYVLDGPARLGPAVNEPPPDIA